MSEVSKKGSLLNSSNILTKSIAAAFMFHCDAKHSDTLLGSGHAVTCFWVAVGVAFWLCISGICCILRQ